MLPLMSKHKSRILRHVLTNHMKAAADEMMNNAALFCIKFNFGLPLEDIFPPNDIHPRLHNLFGQAYKALEDSELSLKKILKQLEASLSDIWQLKDTLINGNLRYRDGMYPGLFFWLIRHFLGLLPLPLLPKFADGEVYNWEYFSAKCKLNRNRQNYELESEISWWVHKLPKANVMMIYTLMNFLRKISRRSNAVRKLEKNKVLAVTIYFSSSLFLRPYTPGLITTTDALFYPLLFFLIVNWSRIRKGKEFSFQYYLLSSMWEADEKNDEKIDEYGELLTKQLQECGCQTSLWLLTDKKSNRGEISCSSSERLDEEADTETNFLLQQPKQKVDNDGEKAEEQKEESSSKSGEAESKAEKNEETILKQSGDASPVYEEPPAYEEISDSSSNSETAICQKADQKFFTPKLLRQKLVKANVSLANVLSRVNEKFKSKQELLSKSGGKLEHKYNLLEDSKVEKVQSLHANHCVKESPCIKYKKLMTI